MNDNFRILYFRYFIVVYRSPPSTKNRLTFPLFLEEFTSFLERLSFRLIDYCFSPSLTLPPHLYCFPLAPIPKPPPADFCFRPPPPLLHYHRFPLPPLLPAPQLYCFYPTPPPSLHLYCCPPTPSPPTVLFFFSTTTTWRKFGFTAAI